MAKRSFAVTSYTPTATADTTNLADNTTGGFFQGGSATQRTNFIEIYMGGEAGASAPTIMLFGMNSTAGVTITTGTSGFDAPLDAATAALAAPVDTGRATTGTDPQRSATLGHVLTLSYNAFGGIVRWLAAPGEEVSITGASASTGSASLSAFTGGTPGAMSSHVIYETL
jgi:hypothetical protein